MPTTWSTNMSASLPAGMPALPSVPGLTPVLTVVRYLLLDRVTYLVVPWMWAAFAFVLDAVILQLTPAGNSGHRWVGGLAAVFLVVFGIGVQTVARALPFGLALGVSRRTYFLGAALLAVALAVCFGAAVAIGRAAERATDGWGMNMAYFRVSGVLDGPWWQAWLNATAAFVVLFAYGMWYGLVFRRAGLVGTVSFAGAQGVLLTLAAAVITWTHGWTRFAHFFTITALFPAVLATAAVILLAGGLATVRRLTV
ncbi:hypothetical protein [Streptomyces sp. NPDC021020]|uniref:hypothetical protein n=1 Tax=Streptomyces sp. NPDC021020 TaxID=3365109 RepID=UPI0037B74964